MLRGFRQREPILRTLIGQSLVRLLLMAIRLQTLAALVLRHFQSAFFLKITHLIIVPWSLEKAENVRSLDEPVKQKLHFYAHHVFRPQPRLPRCPSNRFNSVSKRPGSGATIGGCSNSGTFAKSTSTRCRHNPLYIGSSRPLPLR